MWGFGFTVGYRNIEVMFNSDSVTSAVVLLQYHLAGHSPLAAIEVAASHTYAGKQCEQPDYPAPTTKLNPHGKHSCRNPLRFRSSKASVAFESGGIEHPGLQFAAQPLLPSESPKANVKSGLMCPLHL